MTVILGRIVLTVLGQLERYSEHGNPIGTPKQGERSETDHTQKRRSTKL